ncbi:MAG TPA: PAS domain S-box protein [Syntrophorhabdaceae bacterium]|jgi:PAS domain S-box-containing protein
MKNSHKTKEQLEQELSALHKRVGELEASMAKRVSEEEGLLEREGRFVTAFLKSAIPIAITTIEEGRYVEVNEAFSKSMGLGRDDIIGKTSTGIGCITEEQRSLFLRELRQKEQVENLELRMTTGGGEKRYGLFNATKIHLGKEDFLLTMVTDITDRRLVENALRQSEERSRRLNAASFGGICIHDKGIIKEANQTLASMVGYEPWELIDRSGLDFIAPEFREMVAKNLFCGYEKPFDTVALRKDGSTCFLEAQAKKIPFDGGQLSVIEFRDITERKRAEEAFRESERRYRELCESLPEIVAEFDEKGNFEFVNQNGFKAFGYTKEDLDRGLNVFQMVAPEDRPRLLAAIQKILAGEQTAGAEYGMVKKDGSTITAVAYTNPIIRRDMVVGYRTILIDITDRKQAEEALRRSETRYRTLLESINDGVYILDEKGCFTFVNDVIVTRTGRPKKWFIGRHFLELIRPDYRGFAREGFAANLRGEMVPAGEAAIAYAEPPRRMLWVELSTRPLFEEGRVTGIIGTSRDISARKHAEDALRKSEERFRRLAENARDMIYRRSLSEGEYQYVSPASVELTGYGPNDFYSDPLLGRKIVHPDWATYFIAGEMRLRSGETTASCEYKILHKSGEERWLYQRDVLVCNNVGEPMAIEGIVTDISERKKAEEALRDSEEKYRSIFERSPLGIFQTTLEGRFIRVNPALAGMLGYDSPEELIHAISDIGAQLYAEPGERAEVLRTVLESDGQRVFENDYFRKDGSRARGHLTLSVVRDENGAPHHLDGIVEDITEKKKMGEKLQNTMAHLRALSHRLLEVQEKERRHIARELHDEIGQTLTALKISLKRAERAKRPGPARASISEDAKMVEGLIKQVRSLSIELRPSILDDFGLTAALEWYVNWISDKAEVKTEFRTKFKEERLAPLIELTCFRIAQEALTNAVRHAGAHKIVVDLKAVDEELHLTVKDDGHGFDVEKTHKRALKGKTFGLLGMEERASLAGGSLKFISEAGKGTTVHAVFPLQALSGQE